MVNLSKMSADDFQTKYASVMESMLKSAVAETTKLFETMVDELKAEISSIRKENEDLKTRCRQLESERNPPTIYFRESEHLQGRSDKRDTAVQCDPVPFHTMLVEECQPLRHSSLQNQQQQCSYEGIEYTFQEHNYVIHRDGNSQMACVIVKEEQEEVESTVLCRQVLSEKADWASTCGMENEGPFINNVRSTGEITLLQRHEENLVALQHPLVISVPAIKDDMENDSDVSPNVSEIAQHQSDSEPLDKEQSSVVPQKCHRKGETSVNKHSDVTLRNNADVQTAHKQLVEPTRLHKEVCNEEKNGVAEVGASSQSDLPVKRRRGRPPKKAKHLQQPVKAKPQTEVKKSPTVRVEEAEASPAVDALNSTSSQSTQACPVHPKKSSSIITPPIQERANSTLEDAENCKVGILKLSVASLRRRCSSRKEKTSHSQQPSTDIEEMTIQIPSTEVSCPVEKLNTSGVKSPQASSVKPRERSTSVTLQDAILLVEAMNQSITENTDSSPQRTAAKAQSAPSKGALPTLDEAPPDSQTMPLPLETHESAGNLPLTELSTSTQPAIEKFRDPPQTAVATPTSEALEHIQVVLLNQKHPVSLPNTVPPLMPPSTAATQTSVQVSLLEHHPNPSTSVAPSRGGNAGPHKVIIVPKSLSSLMPLKNNRNPPSSTAASVTPGTPSLSSVPQKTIYVTSSKSLPVVTHSTASPTGPQSGNLLHPKITIIVPRQVSALASRKQQSQTILAAQQESARAAVPVMLSSSQFISSSEELSTCASVDTQTTSGKVPAISSLTRDKTSDILESPKQTASVSARTEMCSSINMSFGLVPNSLSPAVPPTIEQNESAVVILSRLPFPISTQESVLVSRLPAKGSSGSQSILKEGTTHKKSSSVVLLTQPSETLVVSTDICPNIKEASVAVPGNASQMSEEPNKIQEKASLASENCTTSNKSPNSTNVKLCKLSKVSQPVLRKSTGAINTTQASAVSCTVGEPTSNVDKEINSIGVQDCALLNDRPVEEEQSTTLIHLTPITSKDTSDPHLQMTKAQFLAQLAVSPVAQDTKKASSGGAGDAAVSCAGTSSSDEKRLQKNSLMAQLRSHIKTLVQASRSETSPEPGTETETNTVSPKKPRLVNGHHNDKTTTRETISLSPKNPGPVGDVTSQKTTTNDPISITPMIFEQCKDGVTPKRTVRVSATVSSRRSNKAISESAPVSLKRCGSGRDGVGSKNKKSGSVSPRRSSSTKKSATPKKTLNTPVRRKRTHLSRDGANPKKTKSTSVSPRKSCLSKNGTNPKLVGSSTKQIKRESNSFSARRRSTTTDDASTKNTKSKTDSPIVKWPKLAEEGVSPRKTGECTSVKNPRLIQDGTSPKRNVRLVNAKNIVKAAKAKTIAEMKNSNQSKFQNGAETSQLSENRGSCEPVNKCTAKAVWTPPRMPTNKPPPVGGKRSGHLPAKKETRSQEHTVVYPPSVSLHPIPVKAPPVVSPLQPLSVIGWRLLKNQCGECGRVLSSSAALESHVSLHSGKRPFSCKLCGKRFSDSKALKRHGRVHRNGRIHICQQCGKGFVYRFGLTKHLQMVHSKIKPFVCQICNKGFFTKRDVEAHIRIHTGEKPFHCNLCEKKFARRVELNVHLRWHNGEKRHWCPYCGKGFLDFNNLKRHKYIHTGEKPHSCPHCPKNFTQSGHLKKHVKNVHKIQ